MRQAGKGEGVKICDGLGRKEDQRRGRRRVEGEEESLKCPPEVPPAVTQDQASACRPSEHNLSRHLQHLALD